MGDFPDYFKVGSWPASTAKAMQEKLSMGDEEMYRFLSYFDTKNLATLVTCPVTTAMGLQDPVCPPHTNFAPYNNFKSEEKHYVVNPECQHETPADWYNAYMDFFKAHLEESTGITNAETESGTTANNIAYNIAGMRVGKDYKGIVIVNGKKYIRK